MGVFEGLATLEKRNRIYEGRLNKFHCYFLSPKGLEDIDLRLICRGSEGHDHDE